MSRPAADAAAHPFPRTALLLAAPIVATAALPHDSAQLGALLVVILLGVPHGALDGEVARPLLRPRFGRWWFPAFALPYLSLAALVLLTWRAAPLITLAAFLAGSAWHFGEEEASPGRWPEALARGGLPIALPTLLHPDATAQVLAGIADAPLDGIPPALTAASWLWVPAAAAVLLSWGRRGEWGSMAEAGLLVLAFLALPPLTAFAVYFVCCHAPRHVGALVAHRALAPRVNGLLAAARRSLPVTALTLMLGVLLWSSYSGPPAERLLTLTLQGLAALTLPHVLLGLLAERAVGRACAGDAAGACAPLPGV